MSSARRAVIDVGTNSVKLLVAEVEGNVVQPILEKSEQTRLGRGFYAERRLQPEAIAQTARAVLRFVLLAAQNGVSSPRIIATSAARDAVNRSELTEAVGAACVLPVEIISGEQEADWVFRGVTSDPKWHGQRLLILDVGGGSSETILGEHDHYTFRQSFDMGSVRLLEKLHPADPPSPDDITGCRAWLAEFFNREVGPALETLVARGEQQPRLIGTCGTTTILARMVNRLDGYDRAVIEATRLTRRQVYDYMVHLWNLPLAERRNIPGLPPSRADVILTGVAIFEAVMAHFNFEELGVSTRGLRFGAVMEAGPDEAARDEFLRFMHEMEKDPGHVRHVSRLAIQLFDGLASLHGLGSRERLLLEAAASLHDIGHRTEGTAGEHHKESARHIRERRWTCFSPLEANLISQIARYHRRSLPQMSHEPYAALSSENRVKVQRLSALLRLADGLDRRHAQFVTSVETEISPERILFHLDTIEIASREIVAATQKADLAEAAFQRKVEFKAKLSAS